MSIHQLTLALGTEIQKTQKESKRYKNCIENVLGLLTRAPHLAEDALIEEITRQLQEALTDLKFFIRITFKLMEKKEKNYDCGVIIGRFQTSDLHSEHIKLIKYVLNRHQKVIILLGISPVLGTRRNPLDFQTR